ncbi:class I SAM-dependent methyltransferase [Ensifer sp. ENS11]|uniref:class I SAM-dependent methyltransferase n=1 Tax=Ensifer sp. ENS11 TaxID=2769291 RepID=UPI00177E7E26|nr:class I SAM-dependent methyltransferase [Ensifer sp. ENS11]MBD9491654.1 class I SAM-dependent methyltransferase [Ensifer sp. ENS11]
MLPFSLKSLVKRNSLLWGEDVAEDYHGVAARDMQIHWDTYIAPAVSRHPIDYTSVVDFACGYGRNTDLLLQHADHVTMIDVNKHNVEYCQAKYADNAKVTINECNGYDLRNIADGSCTFFYTFDSMVHFPPKILKAYIPEFFRVLTSGGYALIHHSNYTAAGPNADFKANPHWRNYMSAELFADIAKAAGFTVAEQKIHPWAVQDLDCVSVLRKP